ncbi:MAG: hypothetical protein HUJ54_14955, partial [Erysipelotrichaceae bacterium]|nr:hypothetical protein [Erysipelotrichaceae bacterium]
IQKAASSEKMADSLFWMNFSMVLQIPQKDKIQLHSNLAGVDVTMGLPEFPEVQKGYTRTYKIYAYHGDSTEGEKLEIITPKYDAEKKTLSFKVSRCSTYAIGYADAKDPAPQPDPDPDPKPDPTPTPTPDPTPDPKPSTDPTPTSNPASSSTSSTAQAASARTAARTNSAFWILLTLAGCTGLFLTELCRAPKRNR